MYLGFLAVNATVVVLRIRRPELPRPFRSPWAVGPVPMLAVGGFVAAAAMLPQLRASALLVGLGLVAVGAVAQRGLASTPEPAEV